MKAEESGCVVVVDESGEFLFLEDCLQTPLSPVPVIGFDDARQFVETILNRRKRRPYAWLVVIADSAAMLPSIDEGVFFLVGKTVSAFYGVLFTTRPRTQVWEEWSGRNLIAREEHIVPRGDPDAPGAILQVTQEIVHELCRSADLTTRKAQRPRKRSEGKRDNLDDRSKALTRSNNVTRVRDAKEGEGPVTTGTSGTIHRDTMEPQEAGDPQDEQKRRIQHTLPVKLDDLVQRDSRLYRLLEKDTLNFFERLLLRETAWDLFDRLSRSDPMHLEKYRTFAYGKASITKKSGRQVIRQVLSYFPATQESHEDQGR